ncbi:MAG: 50S ribosomal protein L4 [bacterium]|nr:50S ribosomal protein L4 [bacterium]
MKTRIVSITGENKGDLELSSAVFGVEVNQSLMAQAVRVYLANQRQGNAHTKGRGDVTGSTRKIFKQKGTGNARHGDIKAPTFVGGGIVHGPQKHSFTLAIPVKMRRAALRSALSARVADVVVVDGFVSAEAKTSVLAKGLKTITADKKKPLIVLTPEMGSAIKAMKNIDGIDYMQAQDLNTYEVLNHGVIVLSKESLPILDAWIGKAVAKKEDK